MKKAVSSTKTCRGLQPTRHYSKTRKAKDLRGCDRRVSNTRKALQASKSSYSDTLHSTNKGCFDVVVSKTSLHRSLLICEAIVRCASAAGVDIKSEGNSLIFDFGQDSFGFSIREKSNRIEQDTTSPWKSYEYKPSGELRIQVEAAEFLPGIRWQWKDGKVQRLEQVITSFITAVPQIAAKLKEQRLEREERSRLWELERQEQEKQRKQAEREAQLRSELLDLAREWTEACRIRAFCDSFQKSPELINSQVSESSKEQWLAWARSIADEIDPIRSRRAVSVMKQI